ncbi:MAG: hypothetical protein ABIU63_13645 [Chitinophagaceae bacterium]
MKKTFTMLFAIALTLGAAAQSRHEANVTFNNAGHNRSINSPANQRQEMNNSGRDNHYDIKDRNNYPVHNNGAGSTRGDQHKNNASYAREEPGRNNYYNQNREYTNEKRRQPVQVYHSGGNPNAGFGKGILTGAIVGLIAGVLINQ